MTFAAGDTLAASQLNAQAAHVTRVTTQSIASGGGGTAIQFTATSLETVSTMWDISVPTDVIIPADGTYTLTGWVQYAAAAGGVRSASLIKNGSGTNMPETKQAAGGSGVDNVTVATEMPLVAGDVIRLNAFQTSGGAVNVVNARLTVRRVVNV